MSDVAIKEVRFGEPDVQKLVSEALEELSQRYGGNGDDTPIGLSDFDPPAGRFFVACAGAELIGCGGYRVHGEDAELKRMFTTRAARGRGVARAVLAAIENAARADGLRRVILETGDRQPEAITLYESSGYARIEDFGYYKDEEGVLSYAKEL